MKNSNEELSVRTNFYLSKILHQRLRKCVEHGKKTGQIKSMSRLVNNLLEDFVENYERNGLTSKLERETLKKITNTNFLESEQLLNEENVTPDFVKNFLKSHGLTQRRFAEDWAKIETPTLNRFLTGKTGTTKYLENMILFGMFKFFHHQKKLYSGF